MKLTLEEIQQEYSKRCKACLKPHSRIEYYVLADAARNYGQAIKDILGGTVWLDMVVAISLDMPADVATVGGIPINFPELEKQ